MASYPFCFTSIHLRMVKDDTQDDTQDDSKDDTQDDTQDDSQDDISLQQSGSSQNGF